jgi:hypothetical protein
MLELWDADLSVGPPRCAHCGDVIGVYEPLLEVVGDALERETSRAAEPDLSLAGGAAWYHAGCYRRREDR